MVASADRFNYLTIGELVFHFQLLFAKALRILSIGTKPSVLQKTHLRHAPHRAKVRHSLEHHDKEPASDSSGE